MFDNEASKNRQVIMSLACFGIDLRRDRLVAVAFEFVDAVSLRHTSRGQRLATATGSDCLAWAMSLLSKGRRAL